MKELVEVVAKALVDNPDEVVVTEKTEGKNIVLELHVAASDMGKVIGKQGRIAKAIRSVVKAASSKDNTRVDVEIVEFRIERSLTLSGETYRRVFLRFLAKSRNGVKLYGRSVAGRHYHFHPRGERRSKGISYYG